MTVASETNKVTYAGDASTTTFSTAFTFASDDEVSVTLVDSTTGGETAFTRGTQYTLTGAGTGSAGTVTIVTSPTDYTPASGKKLVIQLKPDFLQQTDLPRGGTVSPADTLEPMHDSRVRQMLRLKDELDRAIKVPIDETSASNLPNVTSRAGKILAFDSSGNPEAGDEIGDYKGNWAASTYYAKRDLVKDTSTNNIFRANTSHTSSGAQPLTTNTDSAKWDKIVDAAAAGTSAAAAAASATAAASSATASASSATSAATAQSASETAQAASEAARDSATASASSATASAATATTKSSEAATSATAAAASAALISLPLAAASGGTGASDAAGARSNLGAAALGANSDITSLTGLTTDLSVAQGGTGASTLTANGVLFGNGTSAIGATAVGSANQVLTSNGAGAAPTFQDAGGGGAVLQSRVKNLGSFSTSSQNGDAVPTGWSDTITMASSSNAILFEAQTRVYHAQASANVYIGIALYEGSTKLTAPGLSSTTVTAQANHYDSQNDYITYLFISWLYKPGTSSAITYNLNTYTNTGSQSNQTVYWNYARMRLTEIDGSIVTIT